MSAFEPWGNTCPLLKVARHYGVDYGDVLVLADIIQHRRKGYPRGSMPVLFDERGRVRDPAIYKGVWRACYDLAEYMEKARSGRIDVFA